MPLNTNKCNFQAHVQIRQQNVLLKTVKIASKSKIKKIKFCKIKKIKFPVDKIIRIMYIGLTVSYLSN